MAQVRMPKKPVQAITMVKVNMDNAVKRVYHLVKVESYEDLVLTNNMHSITVSKPYKEVPTKMVSDLGEASRSWYNRYPSAKIFEKDRSIQARRIVAIAGKSSTRGQPKLYQCGYDGSNVQYTHVFFKF
jgi:hypothetical protein